MIRKTFLFACTVAFIAFLMVLTACYDDGDTEYKYTQDWILLIKNHSNNDITLMEVLLNDGGNFRTEVHNLNVPPGTMDYEIVISQRKWKTPSGVGSIGASPVSMDIEDATGHRETFTYEWWNADTWQVGDASYYRLTVDFQGGA